MASKWLCGARSTRRNVRGLEALWTLGNLKFHRLTFVQRFVAVSLNGRKVNENVLAGLALNEPVALAGIEPLDRSLFSHVFSFLIEVVCLLFLEDKGLQACTCIRTRS
jgi:hypothetical protein